jgi:hypothetical protein
VLAAERRKLEVALLTEARDSVFIDMQFSRGFST